LRNQLFTLKLIYCWAKSKGINLDELLLIDGELEREQIKELVNELQNVRSKRTRNRVFLAEEKGHETGRGLRKRIAEAPVAVAIDPELTVIENFLSWVSDPINVGVKPNHPQKAISIDRLNSTKAIVRTTLNAYRVGTLPSRRPEPLNADELKSLHRAIDPLSASKREPLAAASLFPRTPWEMETSLRNWLMVCIAEHCGLRIGEILKLTIEDIASLTPGGALVVHVLRRPDDPRDTRTHPPAVKTLERVLEVPLQLRWGFKCYLTSRSRLARFAGKTPYLFVTEAGDPLSYSSAHSALEVLGKHVGITRLTWHTLRHTWAELLAKELFAVNGIEEHAMEKLRYLGGWSERSQVPFQYIRNAIRDSANQFLRKRNEQMYQEADQRVQN
jgi:integrase